MECLLVKQCCREPLAARAIFHLELMVLKVNDGKINLTLIINYTLIFVLFVWLNHVYVAIYFNGWTRCEEFLPYNMNNKQP